MTLHLRSLLVFAVDALASIGNAILNAWVGPQIEPTPAPPQVAAMPVQIQRDVCVPAEAIELAQHDAITHLLRRVGWAATPVSARAEIVALEAVWRAPAAEVRDV